MVDKLLTGVGQLPAECEKCLKGFVSSTRISILDIYCSKVDGGLAMMVATTAILGDVRVVGDTQIMFCPRGG